VNDDPRPHDRLPRTGWVRGVAERGLGRPVKGTGLTRANAGSSSPFLVEVTGVAGAGKSTLARLLCQGETGCRHADFIHARTPKHLVYFAHSLPRLLPLLTHSLGSGPRVNWAEFKLLVYVTEWHRFLNRQSRNDQRCTVLDQGPLYALVRLRAESPAWSAPVERWWDQMIELWASKLKLIVWLDASDQVVWDRINVRMQRHKTKGQPPEVGRRFIVRYRQLFEEVLERVDALGGGGILRFDTSATSGEEIAAQLRPLLGARDRQPKGERS
jgi:hypothetical protein